MTDAPFSRKLDLVLKILSMSRGRLAQEAGLDKSLVGRWVAGTVAPSSHNLEKVTAAIARRRPGFTLLDWDRSLPALAERLGGSVDAPTAAPGELPPGTLTFPYDVTGPARRETARRGDEYCGFYRLYRRSFGRPGRIGCLAFMVRKKDGLLELREGAPGFEHRGWGLLMLNRLYGMFAEEKFESMSFMITNAGQQPRAQVLHAAYLGVSSDGLLTPKAAPLALVRAGDVSDDLEADEAAYESLKAEGGMVAPEEVPPAVLAFINRDYGPGIMAAGGPDMVTAPPPELFD